MTEIFRTDSADEALVVASFLEASGIAAWINDRSSSPALPVYFLSEDPVLVFVPDDEAAQARELIASKG